MQRPTKLNLMLNETHPTKRSISSDKWNKTNCMVVNDMTQMANFVYNYYMERVKQMKNYYEEAQKKWQKPGECEIKEHNQLVSTHPGEDRDTDSEDESDGNKQLPVPIEEEPVSEVTEVTETEATSEMEQD